MKIRHSLLVVEAVTLSTAGLFFKMAYDTFGLRPDDNGGLSLYAVAAFWLLLAQVVLFVHRLRSGWWMNKNRRPSVRFNLLLLCWAYMAVLYALLFTMQWSPLMQPLFVLVSTALTWLITPSAFVMTGYWLWMKWQYRDTAFFFQ